MENENSEGGEQLKSKYNSAINILMRIDELWKGCHTYCRKGDYKMWNLNLERVYVELYADMSDEEVKEYNNLNTAIETIGFKYNKETMKLTSTIKLYRAILDKELYLRKTENSQGKGVSYQDSSEDYMDG